MSFLSWWREGLERPPRPGRDPDDEARQRDGHEPELRQHVWVELNADEMRTQGRL